MLKLRKYLKPFIGGVIAAVVLLFCQALSELNLPNYMSDIVNVGIQQNGVEHAAPDAISREGLDFITALMPEEDRALVLEHYSLYSPSEDSRGREYGELYPGATESPYIRQSTDEETLEALDKAFGRATWTMVTLMQDASDTPNGGGTGDIDISSVDPSELYAATPLLAMMPEGALRAAQKTAAGYDESILNQSGVMLTQIFYQELGLNLTDIQSAYVMRIGVMMLLVALAGGVASVLVSLLSSRIAAGVARNLRRDVFAKIESFSSAEFDRFSTASLITRCTNDITQVQMLLMMGIRMVCFAPIMGVGGIVMAVGKSVSMSWVIALACVVLLGLMMIVMAVAMPRFKIIQRLVDRLNLVSRENLTGMMVVRAFGTQGHETERFDGANQDLTRTNLFVNRVMSLMMPAMGLIMNGVTLLIVWVGANQIAASAMQVGDMMAYIQYAMQIIMSFLMISMMFIMLPRAAVSAARVAEVLETGLSIKDPETPDSFDPAQRGVVSFKNVNFRYHGADEDALHGITFTALPGQTTAIIGPTGSGKSTIASLILRFYDASQGEVLVDGADVRHVLQKDLRDKIGYVPQKGVLLSGTVASNLRYGNREAGEAQLRTVAEVAQASGFIEEKPEGYEGEIAQGGTNVSGGQRQRLAIARALARDPEILIFDDSFSALDFRTDAALRAALKEHTGDATVIVVAQRVSTIMGAEQILVLDEGKIIGRGTHRELLESCPAYYEIASSQLSKEELA